MIDFCIRIFIFSGIFLAACNTAFAQVAPVSQLPGSADVGRLKQQIENEQKLQSLKNSIVGIGDVSTFILPIPKGADEITFKLQSLNIVGATVLEKSVLAGDMQKRIGSTVTLADIYKLANTITKKYWDADYAFSRAIVPAQKIESGKITIQVIEGYLYKIENAESVPNNAFREKLQELTKQRPLRRSLLEGTMLQTQVLSGKQISSTLIQNRNPNKQEAFSLRIETQSIKPTPRYVAEFGNSGSRYNGPFSGSISAAIPNWLIEDGETSITALTSVPLDRQNFLGISQLIPLAPGTNLNAGASVARSDPGYLLAAQDVEGLSYQFSLGLNQDIVRSRGENLVGSFTFDYINSANDILGTQFFDDRIRVVRTGLDWTRSDSFGGTTFGGIKASQGLDILNASRRDSLLLSRAEGRSDFTKFSANVLRQQNLQSDLLGIVSINGQYAPHPLLSTEEFGYGGVILGRGYDSSEITGDSGLSGSIELRYHGLKPISEVAIVPYTFFDIGKVWNKDIGSENPSAASTGFGAIMGFTDNLELNIAMGIPLWRDVATPPNYANGNSPRFLFNLKKPF